MVAHDLASGLVARGRHAARARPQVGGGQVVVLAVELGVQQRAPQRLPEAVAAELAQPGLERHRLEVAAVLLHLAARHERAEAHLVDRAQAREGQQLARRGHRREPALLVEADAAWPQAELVLADADLGRERTNAVVGGQHDVVVAVDWDRRRSAVPARPPSARRPRRPRPRCRLARGGRRSSRPSRPPPTMPTLGRVMRLLASGSPPGASSAACSRPSSAAPQLALADAPRASRGPRGPRRRRRPCATA